ncbi:MAG: hypothetical protein RRY18_05455, partial [Clostridia bacterium]
TECGAVEAVWWARGNHPWRANRNGVCGWVVSLSYEVQRDVAQAKIMNYINPDWVEDIVMMSGKKASAEYGVVDYILAEKNFRGRRLTLYGLMKNRLKIFMKNVK